MNECSIFIIEDDQAIVDMYYDVIAHLGYAIAGHVIKGDEATAVFNKLTPTPDVVIIGAIRNRWFR